MLSYQTISPDTLELLRRLMAEPLFNQTRLVGGTALALQMGHRSSIDLDLFGTIEEDTDLTTETLRVLACLTGETAPHDQSCWLARLYVLACTSIRVGLHVYT